MKLEAIEKRLSKLEKQQHKGKAIFFSTQFEKYEDYLVEAKKVEDEYSYGISSINVIPLANELRECLQRMEAASMDEDLIGFVREQLEWREEEEKRIASL